MLNTTDHTNLITAKDNATQLIKSLQELAKASNPLLADIALELINTVATVEQILNRLLLINNS